MFADALNSIFVRAYLALKREEGQTMIEYSLIGFLVAIAAVATLVLLGGKVNDVFVSLKDAL
jgi:Flp pilus assembly pilin Flp